MTLTTRLSLFFLGALAVVLVGFSAALYSLVRTYLYRQIDDRLEAALDVLSATAEVKPNGIEWEAKERPVSLEPPPGAEPIAWCVRGDRGQTIDARRFDRVLSEAAAWRVHERCVPADLPLSTNAGRGHHDEDNKDRRYAFIQLSAALPLTPVETALRRLLVLLGSLSLGSWIMAALVGGWLCRRALLPVRRMAAAAAAMNADDPAQRLPAVNSGDELQELNRAFNQLLGRWQESFERQRRFTGDASHQLRTPLTALLGQIEIALRHPRSADEYLRTLKVLHSQTLQLRQIIDSLLFLARADAEAKSLPLERLDLHDWLKEHLATWSGHARAADIRLHTSGDGSFAVHAQAALLRQLLDNLLDNACKYSASGTPIAVSLSAEADRIRLTVADSGCGIAEEDIPHLFQAFYRSAQARRQGLPGLGLGLAVAQRIAAALGSCLHVHSQPGQGAQFVLHLPRSQNDISAKNA